MQTAKKILLVDDEPKVLSGLERQLARAYPVVTAPGPNEGLIAFGDGSDFAVVVADMRMPGMNGVEFLARIKEVEPDVVRMMLTGNADQATAVEAINEGSIFRFLSKPCPPEKLTDAISAGLRQHQLITSERELLEKTLHGSIKVLTEILAMAEPKAFGQAELMRDNIRRLAKALKLNKTWELEVAAMLAEIGSLTIPPEVMLRARMGYQLTSREQEILQRVPAIGGGLLAQIPRLEEVARIIACQHKRFDGSGFPADDLKGEAIPIGARMLRALSDLADLERKGKTRASALEVMRTRQGWYDPQIVEALSSPILAATLDQDTPAKPTLAVTLPQLRVGQVLSADVLGHDGIMIVCAGTKITPGLMERLKNFSALSGIKEPLHVEA